MAKKKKVDQSSEMLDSMMVPSVPLVYQRPIGDITEEAYLRFGSYVNNHRHMPRVIDGLKTSYRRLIHSALSFPIGKDIPTVQLIGKMSETHPHSLTGVEGTVRMFVKSGIFDGDGNFGQVYIDGSEASPAAPRYTKVRISDTYQKILGELLKEVPWSESPVGAPEPEYIPTPFPLCLQMSEKVSGLGVAVKSDMPNFSARSLYEAYIHNDPMRLEPNIDIVLDKEHSDLCGLWNSGQGKITYAYHLARQKSDDGKTEGVLFYGDTGMFTLKMKKFQKLIDDGKITVDNVSDQSGTKLLVSRVPGARGITIEDIEDLCAKNCYSTTNYSLNVSDGSSTFRIPLYNWLDYTYKNYLTLVTAVNNKKINQVTFEIAVQEALPAVVDYVINKPTAENKEISDALGLPIEIVQGVMTKPISYLRKNKDTAERVKELKKRLAELKKFDAVKFTEEVIKEL